MVAYLKSLSEILPYLAKGRKINVGSGTGNRRDEDIIEFGRTIGRIYDSIVICDSDRRRRKEGETAELVKKGILDAGLPAKSVAIIVDEDKAIQKALRKALVWNQTLLDGKASTLTELAKKENVAQRYICDLIKLAYLAPDIMEAIIEGRIPAGLTLVKLKKRFSMDWQEQRQLLKIST